MRILSNSILFLAGVNWWYRHVGRIETITRGQFHYASFIILPQLNKYSSIIWQDLSTNIQSPVLVYSSFGIIYVCIYYIWKFLSGTFCLPSPYSLFSSWSLTLNAKTDRAYLQFLASLVWTFFQLYIYGVNTFNSPSNNWLDFSTDLLFTYQVILTLIYYIRNFIFNREFSVAFTVVILVFIITTFSIE